MFLGRVAVLGELGTLLAQPRMQLTDERATALLAHAQALLRSKTVDLTLDGEQDIDARNRLGRNRHLAEPRQIKESCVFVIAVVLGLLLVTCRNCSLPQGGPHRVRSA